jgi:hypothetical protein
VSKLAVIVAETGIFAVDRKTGDVAVTLDTETDGSVTAAFTGLASASRIDRASFD